MSVTIHLSEEAADALLTQHGWTTCRQPVDVGPPGRSYTSFTRPGHQSRAEGGQAGTDYLWERDDALTDALTAATEPRTLLPGHHTDVKVDEHTIRLGCDRDADGNAFVLLAGIGCDLDGEMPGLYYPVARTETGS